MRFDRILLVSPKIYKGKYLLALHPLAGLGYVAESLIHSGFSISVLDMNLQYNYEDLEKRIARFKPDIIGFTFMTFGYKDLYGMISKIKKIHPNTAIVVGGPHVSTLREKVLHECPGIDYGIILEGDLTMLELCKGKELNQIQGLIYRKNGEIIISPFDKFIVDLDKIPFPKYEAFELSKYPIRQIGIVTSRGCPFSCIYCPIVAAIGKKFRFRSAENVVDEVEYWYNRGYRKIAILDDNFTIIRKRTEEICELLRKKNLKGLGLRCPNGIRADKVDYGLLKTMKEVGFEMISFGVESADNKVLKNIKKGEDIETIENSIKIACELGFDVQLFFIIGSPGESLKDVEKSFCLAMRYPIMGANFYNIIPFPNTELYNWIKENGYLLRPIEDIMNNASHFVNEPSFFTPEMSAEDRKQAFDIGQKVSRKVRRRFIESKISAHPIIKNIFSLIYTAPFIEMLILNNMTVIKIKENLKKIL